MCRFAFQELCFCALKGKLLSCERSPFELRLLSSHGAKIQHRECGFRFFFRKSFRIFFFLLIISKLYTSSSSRIMGAKRRNNGFPFIKDVFRDTICVSCLCKIFFITGVCWSFWSFGQNRFRKCQNRHYNKYYIFIYSEQMTQSENENDHFDLDHFDRVGKCLVYTCYKNPSLFSRTGRDCG